MAYVCSLCNGLASLDFACPDCGEQMEDKGEVEDYLGPYSPYAELHVGELAEGRGGYCTHLFSCPACGRDKRVRIEQIRM